MDVQIIDMVVRGRRGSSFWLVCWVNESVNESDPEQRNLIDHRCAALLHPLRRRGSILRIHLRAAGLFASSAP